MKQEDRYQVRVTGRAREKQVRGKRIERLKEEDKTKVEAERLRQQERLME